MSYSITLSDMLVLLASAPILIAICLFDLREMRIPNWLSLIGLGLFACLLPVVGLDEAGMRILASCAVFAVCFALFAVGWLGGGDAKILPVTMLYVPSVLLPIYSYAFAIAMLAGMALIWAVRQKFCDKHSQWISMRPGSAFPMGISIATAPILTVAACILLKWGTA